MQTQKKFQKGVKNTIVTEMITFILFVRKICDANFSTFLRNL